MKKGIRLFFALALLCVASSVAMFAADNAYLYLVHGIPGRDVSASTDPQFPVDVQLNGDVCYSHGLAFGAVAGPLTLAPGSYEVRVSVANSLAPCSNPALIDTTVTLGSGKDVSAVVALSETGTPTLLTFTNNVFPVGASVGRVFFAQAADAPAVQVVLENTATKKLYPFTVSAGGSFSATLPAGDYTVVVNQGTTALVTSTSLRLDPQSVVMLLTVGQAGNNTVILVSKTVRDVI
jgi:hypothetical protein